MQHLDQLRLACVLRYYALSDLDDGQELVSFLIESSAGFFVPTDVQLYQGDIHTREKLSRLVAGSSQVADIEADGRLLHFEPPTRNLRVYYMRKAQARSLEEEINFSYEGKPLPPNLLDYRYMFLSMSRWADTGRIGCLGTLTMALTLLLICLLALWGYTLLASG